VAYSSVLPIGSRHITNDLAIGLRISLDSAEKVKLFLSDGPRKIIQPVDGLETEPEKTKPDDIDLTTLGLPEQLNKVSNKTLIDGIIRPRLNEIFTMVGLEIKKSGFGGQTPSGVVITGGGAKTVGVTEAAKRMLAMPVRVGAPTDMKGIVDEASQPSFAAVIGLARYASLQEEGTSSLNFKLPGNIKFDKMPKKILDLIKSFIP
jgi:cell division protein FtsA